MQGHNIFAIAHTKLKVQLCKSAQCLQQTDFTNAIVAVKVLRMAEAAIELSISHANKLDRHVFPAIADYELSVVDALKQEQKEDRAIMQYIQNLVEAFYNAVALSTKKLLGEELSKTFVAFTSSYQRRLAKIEDVITPFLLRYYSQAELAKIACKIGSLSAQQMSLCNLCRIGDVNKFSVFERRSEGQRPQSFLRSFLDVVKTEASIIV